MFLFEKFCIESNKISFFFKLDSKVYKNQVLFSNLKLNSSDSNLEQIAFLLGFFLIPYFWKLKNIKKVSVSNYHLTEKQVSFFEVFLQKGLGEFRYRNNLDPVKPIKVVSTGSKVLNSNNLNLEKKAVILAGGGKDSVVSGEIASSINLDYKWLVLNPREYRRKNIERSSSPNPIICEWNFDPKFKKEVKYEGHVPLTSILSTLGLLGAYLSNSKYIITSNEYSANFGNHNIDGFEINHQYTKSFEFEKLFSEFVHENISPDFQYFSLLRSLYEIQIAKLFSKSSRYFESFISCNNPIDEKEWCLACPKCAFVFLILYSFLSEGEVLSIWGEDLFFNKNIVKHIHDLCFAKIKPFECVGTKEESLLGVRLALEKNPKILQREIKLEKELRQGAKSVDLQTVKENLLYNYKREHNFPSDLENLIYKHFEDNLKSPK